MKTTVREASDHVQELTVSLDGTDLKVYLDQARKRLAAEVTVDGFRKGHAPDDIAAKHLSDDQIKQAAMELAVEGSFSQAVRELGWDVAKTEKLDVTKNDSEELAYRISVAVWPEVSLEGLSDVHVARRDVRVTDEQVDEALDTIRNMKASFLDKEGPVAEGDRVEIDFTSSVDGKPVPGGEGTNHPLIVGGKTFMPGFEEKLIGLTKDVSSSFQVQAPEDYARAELAGKTVDFSVTVRAVQIVMRPDINDEFAKTLNYENAQALKDAARASVVAQETMKERDRVRLAIMDSIVEKADIPTPSFLVDEELDRMLARFEQDLAGKGLGLEMYLTRLKKSRDDVREQWRPEAERQVRMSLVVRQAVKERDIRAESEEIERTMQETIARFSDQEGFSADALDTDALKRTIEDRLVTEKALSFLEEACTAKTA